MRIARSRPKSLSTNSRRTFRSATKSLRPDDLPFLYSLIMFEPFMIKLGHGWLPVGGRDRRCGATIQPETVRSLTCTSVNPAKFGLSSLSLSLRSTTAADLRCIIVQGIQIWFPVYCFYILKGPFPRQWNIEHALFFRAKGLDPK
jgi:hypothetical protein